MKKKAQHLRLHSSKSISNQDDEGEVPSGQWEENLTGKTSGKYHFK